MDLIDRQQALMLFAGDVAAQNELSNLPAVQPERKIGYWIDKTDSEWDGEWDDWKCSCCGAVLSSMAINLNGTYLYCPKCGAYMRGERDAVN